MKKLMVLIVAQILTLVFVFYVANDINKKLDNIDKQINEASDTLENIRIHTSFI